MDRYLRQEPMSPWGRSGKNRQLLRGIAHRWRAVRTRGPRHGAQGPFCFCELEKEYLVLSHDFPSHCCLRGSVKKIATGKTRRAITWTSSSALQPQAYRHSSPSPEKQSSSFLKFHPQSLRAESGSSFLYPGLNQLQQKMRY